MGGQFQIDASFDFRTDATGPDVDSSSPTLKKFHQNLWSKELPSRKRIIQLLQNLAVAGVTVVVVAHEAEKDLVWADKVLQMPV